MSSFTNRLALPNVSTGVDSLVVHNRGLAQLDAMVHGCAATRSLSAPPGGLAAGDTFIVKPTGTGSWAGKSSYLMCWSGTAWISIPPVVGMRIWIEDEQVVATYLTGGWTTRSGLSICAGQKTSPQNLSNSVGTYLDVEWDSMLVDLSNSEVFEHDNSNPEQVIIREAGNYRVNGNLTVMASGTVAWIRLQGRVAVGTIGSPNPVTGGNFFTSIRVTDFPYVTMNFNGVFAVLADQELRIQVARQTTSGSTTLTVTEDSRITVEQI